MPNQPSVTKSRKSLKQDVFDHPDFYQIDDLLSEEHKLIRYSIREFVDGIHHQRSLYRCR